MGNVFDTSTEIVHPMIESTKLLSTEESNSFRGRLRSDEIKPSLIEMLHAFDCRVFPDLPKYIELCIYKSNSFPKDIKIIEIEEYFAAAIRTSSYTLMRFLYDPVDMSSDGPYLEKIRLFLEVLIEFSLLSEMDTSGVLLSAQRIYQMFEQHVMYYKCDEGFDTLHSWISQYFPHVFDVVYDKIYSVFTQNGPSSSSRRFRAPILLDDSKLVQSVDIMFLAFESSLLQGEWKRLYTTEVDGQSFNRILYHISGYGGPTCILISCRNQDEEAIIGAFASGPWKESNRFHGIFKVFPIVLHLLIIVTLAL